MVTGMMAVMRMTGVVMTDIPAEKAGIMQHKSDNYLWINRLFIVALSLVALFYSSIAVTAQESGSWVCADNCDHKDYHLLTVSEGEFKGGLNIWRADKIDDEFYNNRLRGFKISINDPVIISLVPEYIKHDDKWRPAGWDKSVYPGDGNARVDVYLKKADGKEEAVGLNFHAPAGSTVLYYLVQDTYIGGSVATYYPAKWRVSVYYGEEKPADQAGQQADNQSATDDQSQNLDDSQVDDDSYVVMKVDAVKDMLKADGKSTSNIQINLYERLENGDARPMKGKQVSLKISPQDGKVTGSLSSNSVATSSGGEAVVTYTAPQKQDLPQGVAPTVEIVAVSGDSGASDETYIRLFALNDMVLLPQHNIMPAHKDYRNKIKFKFEDPNKDRGEEYKATVSVSSRYGRIASGNNEPGNSRIEMDAVAMLDNDIFYYWDGPQPTDKAVDETVSIEIPKLGISGIARFSVGIDLEITKAGFIWNPPFQPNLTIPIKVVVRDRFHPDTNLAKLFEEFEIKPNLMVKKTGFAPLDLLQVNDETDDELSSAVSRFIERSLNANPKYNYLAHDLMQATVRRTKQNEWLLLNNDLDGSGLSVEQAYPVFIPFARGVYKTSVRFEPRFKGDASQQNQEMALAAIEVSRLSAGQGTLEYFMLPTIKGVASLSNPAGLFLGLTDISLKLRNKNYNGAFIDAGLMLAGKFIGDRIAGKLSKAVKDKYLKQSRAYYRDMVAKAFGKNGKVVSPDQRKLALELAKPYKLAAWVDAMASWAFGQEAGNALEPLKGGNLWPQYQRPEVLAKLASLSLTASYIKQSDKVRLVDKTFAYLEQFLKGYGYEYDLFIVTREGLTGLKVRDQQGNIISAAPKSVYGGTDATEMVVVGKKVVVVPFEHGQSISVDMKGKGAPVEIYTISNGKTKKTVLDYKGKPWSKKMTIGGKNPDVLAATLVGSSSVSSFRPPSVVPQAKPVKGNGRIGGDWSANDSAMHFPDVTKGAIKATYGDAGGRILATLKGNHLTGTWIQNHSDKKCHGVRDGSNYWGWMEFEFDKSFSSFKGKWGYCEGAAQAKGWNGKKTANIKTDVVANVADNDNQAVAAECENGAECKPAPAPEPVTDQGMSVTSANKPADNQALDLAFWSSIKDSNNKALFKAYLDKFPNGVFAVIARQKLGLAAGSSQVDSGSTTGSAGKADMSVAELLKKAEAADDNLSALKLYLKASKKGSGEASYQAAGIYVSGGNVKIDMNKAFKYFKLATDRGFTDAWPQYILNLITEDHMQRAVMEFFRFYKASKKDCIPYIESWGDDFRRKVQVVLQKKGFYSGDIDGKIGPASLAAIDAYVSGKKPVVAKTSGLIVSAKGIGSITANTAYRLKALKKALPGFIVKIRKYSAEGDVYTSITAYRAGRQAIAFDGNEKVTEFQVLDASIRDDSGIHPGMSFARVRKTGRLKGMECYIGADDTSDLILCSRPGAAIGYNFENRLGGGDQLVKLSKIPPSSRLKSISWTAQE